MTHQEESNRIREALRQFEPDAQTRDIADYLMKQADWPYKLSATQNRIRTARQTASVYTPPAEGEDDHRVLREECERLGIPFDSIGHYWHKSQHISLFAKPRQVSYDEARGETIEEMKKYAPAYRPVEREPITDGHLLIIDPADVHLGKLCSAFETGEDYDNQIAVQRVRSGVAGIISKAAGFPIDHVLFIVGNDILHIDTPKRTTTAGTPQDTTGMWYDNFRIAKRLYIEIIETLLTIADVTVQYDPSNHDYTNGFFLADTLTSWFSKCPNVTFNTTIAPRKYFRYHSNLIGTTHGGDAKASDLPLLMAHEASEHWGACKHRYFLVHHWHHKISKDYMSVCVETLRSPSGTDSWHNSRGYAHAPKAVEGFIHSKEHGQIARITHLF